MADPAMAANTEAPQASAPSDQFESGADGGKDSKSTTEPSNQAQTLQSGIRTDTLQSSDTTGTNDRTGETEAVSARAEANLREPGVGGATEEQEALRTAGGTGVKKGEGPVQATAAATSDGLKLQDNLDDGDPSTVSDDGAGSATATTNLAGPATGPIPPGNGSDDSSSSDTDEESVDDEAEPDQGLFKAAESGGAKDMKKWLDEGADVLATNAGGETALHIAVQYNNIETVQALLEIYKEKKLGINTWDNDGWTPLHWAARSAPTEPLLMLLDFPGVDLTVKSETGKTPLYFACYWGNVVGAEKILGTKEGVKTLEIASDQGWTPLLVACSEGELGIVNLLISPRYNAKTDIKDVDGRTPLHLASMRGRVAVVQALLQAHADVNVIDSDGHTALHLAIRELAEEEIDGLDVVRKLIDANIKVDVVDFDGRTALQLAGRGEEDVYKEAIKIISGALNLRKRKDFFLEVIANEEPAARDRLFENIEWKGFEASEKASIKEEAELIWMVTLPQKTTQANVLEEPGNTVLEQLKKKLDKKPPPLETYPLPASINKEKLTALQLAAYFGYYRLVYVLLLYSDSEWNKIKKDCAVALKIATYMEYLRTEGTVHPESEKESAMANERKGAKTKPGKSEELKRMVQDYENIKDILNDPPARNYGLVRGWSEIDDFTQEPKVDKALKAVAEQFDATIVDFHQVRDPNHKRGTRVDFLRRTRTVWDVVYAQPKSSPSETDPKSKGAGKESKSNEDKKQPKTASSNKPLEEILNCGPVQIMEDARKKTRRTGSSAKSKTDELYTEENLRFRWLHLSANNVSDHEYPDALK
jgi:ankyrin repeat protein